MRMLVQRLRDDSGCDGEVVLPFELRSRTRLLARTLAGEEIGVLLPRGQPPLEDGEVLATAEGFRVRVRAAKEALLEVTSPEPGALSRAAYHLGNRHVKVEVRADRLRLAEDDVLESMLIRLGATVTRVTGVFRPEHGAYGGGHHHSHGEEPALHYAPRIHDFGAKR